MIRFSDFSFTYASQKTPTLKHINLEIKDGEKVLIIGPSGSGKSTLGAAINGLIPHAIEGKIDGSLTVDGLETKDTHIFELSKKVGTVLQDTDGQFVALTVAEDMAFSLENQQMPLPEMKETVQKTAETVDMQDFLHHAPGALSGGQKQRVSFGGVLVDDVDILLFDEPLANLDPKTGQTAIELIDKVWKKTGKTCIIIEHRLEDVLWCGCDRVILVEEGEITLDTTPDELLRSDILIKAGIREPLYISALKMAGVDIASIEGPVTPWKDFDPSPYRNEMESFLSEHKRTIEQNGNPPEVEFKNVSFSYDGRKDVLKDISFKIRKGEMCAVLGKNGAGKSTMAQLLMGILTPDEGRIIIDGRDATFDDIAKRSKKIGYVMQNPNHMISNAMIYDEVAFALRQNNVPEDKIREKVLAALELCGLRKHWKWPVSALSYGQKKRVTIASVLVMNPDVLILDEPTAGQDWRHYTALMKFIKELNRTLGITIIFVTHDMHLALEYTDHAIVLTDGELLRDSTIGEVFADKPLLEKANLRETSLFSLAEKLGIKDKASFITTFISREDEKREEKPEETTGELKEKEGAEDETGKAYKPKKEKKDRKEKKKFGFGLEYVDIKSPIHSLNGVTKFLILVMWLTLCLTTFDIRILGFALVAGITFLIMAKLPFRKYLPLLILMLFTVSVNALVIFLFSPDQGTVYYGTRHIIAGNPDARYALSIETLFYLITVTMKYFTTFPIALLFVYTTNPSEFASSLNRLGIPYRISYAVSLTMRYIPEVTDDFIHIRNAQQARGVDVSKNVSMWRRMTNTGKLLGPLILSSIDKIDTISNAMILRGFGKKKKRTWYSEKKMKAGDYASILFVALLLTVSLVMRFHMGVMFWRPFA